MDIFNNLQVMNECLLDVKRTNAFQKAISKVVRKGDVVLDAGTGSGILALFAAKTGAQKVYAIDIAEDVIAQTKSNINAGPYKNIVYPICQDLKELQGIPSVDVMIMEMLDTGLVSEQQAVAINHLRRQNIVTDKTRLIPFKVGCYIQALDYDFSFYGFRMPSIIQARNYGANSHIKQLLSKPILYADVDFRSPISTHIEVKIPVSINKKGTLNGICLKTKTYLHEGFAIWGTSDMNMPVIIPLPETQVNAGETTYISVKYDMGEGFGNFAARIV